LSCIMAVKL